MEDNRRWRISGGKLVVVSRRWSLGGEELVRFLTHDKDLEIVF